MTRILRFSLALALVDVAGVAARAQHPAMPPGMSHEEHLAQMQKDSELKQRGAEAMGFDQDKATHHFRLDRTGGSIEVVAKDAADETTLMRIREHLASIAKQFAAGDFGKPVATHAEVPPGVRTMQQRRSSLTFQYQDLASGGRVRIIAADRRALGAVHEFLRYQIREHATGDVTTVSR